MCEETAEEKLAKLTAFEAKIKQLKLVDYEDLKNRFGGLLKKDSFHKSVRDYVISKIPKLEGKYNSYLCPYCGESFNARSMHAEHIIPGNTYLRMKLIQNARDGKYDRSINWSAEVDAIFWSEENIMLACAECNLTKGKTMPLRFAVEQIREYFSGKSKYNHLLDDFDRCYEKSLVGSFIREELALTDWVSEEDGIVGKGMHPSSFAKETKLSKEACNRIAYIIANKTIGTRPSIPYSRDSEIFTKMLSEQKSDIKISNLTLCLCCQGLYESWGMQVDHVRPVGRGWQEHYTKIDYNNNLLAICVGCNTAKRDRPVDEAFIGGRIRLRRKTTGHVGIDLLFPEIKYSLAIRDHYLKLNRPSMALKKRHADESEGQGKKARTLS